MSLLTRSGQKILGGAHVESMMSEIAVANVVLPKSGDSGRNKVLLQPAQKLEKIQQNQSIFIIKAATSLSLSLFYFPPSTSLQPGNGMNLPVAQALCEVESNSNTHTQHKTHTHTYTE